MRSRGDGASKAVAGLGVGKTLDSLKQSLGGEIGAGVEKSGEKLKGLFGN